jgi:hypothetical protein
MCKKANRECDPDLCGGCGAIELLDPVTRHQYNSSQVPSEMCQNVYIQREIPKKTILGYSNLCGMGLFMGEPVAKDQFIGEYKGEVLTQEEAERRGKIYDKRGTSFLFDLNTAQAIDATRLGNKLRFINHSKNEPNCVARIIMANCVHRIGFFATENLRAGEELYFDYGYSNKAVKFVQKEPPRIEWSDSSDEEADTVTVAKPQKRAAPKRRPAGNPLAYLSGGKGTTERSRKKEPLLSVQNKGKGKGRSVENIEEDDEELSEYEGEEEEEEEDEDSTESDSDVPVIKKLKRH